MRLFAGVAASAMHQGPDVQLRGTPTASPRRRRTAVGCSQRSRQIAPRMRLSRGRGRTSPFWVTRADHAGWPVALMDHCRCTLTSPTAASARRCRIYPCAAYTACRSVRRRGPMRLRCDGPRRRAGALQHCRNAIDMPRIHIGSGKEPMCGVARRDAPGTRSEGARSDQRGAGVRPVDGTNVLSHRTQ